MTRENDRVYCWDNSIAIHASYLHCDFDSTEMLKMWSHPYGLHQSRFEQTCVWRRIRAMFEAHDQGLKSL